MAFLTIEDLYGTLEVLVFPAVYDRCRELLGEDEKLFIEGRVSVEDDRPSKLIADRITRFSDIPRELWVAFADKADYLRFQGELKDLAGESEGCDELYVFLRDSKQYRKIDTEGGLVITPETLAAFRSCFGEKNVTVRVKRTKEH